MMNRVLAERLGSEERMHICYLPELCFGSIFYKLFVV